MVKKGKIEIYKALWNFCGNAWIVK
jgi:hypothetical protein